MNLETLRKKRNPNQFHIFNEWVKDFFKREYLRESGRIAEYVHPNMAMRQEVSYWNPNRSKHAEVYWLENFVFGRDDISLTNKILNAMVVKFVGMPTLTLVATNSADYQNIIDFDRYKIDTNYFNEINSNLNTNKWGLHVWGKTQLQTSLQTAARNFVRVKEDNPNKPFQLSDMIQWICHLDDEGLSDTVKNPNHSLKDVCNWLLTYRGIGPYFAYHPPCNFSRANELPNIDENDDYCLVGPGAKRGLEFVFPDVKFSNNSIMEDYILTIRDNQHEFFEFKNSKEREYFINNLEYGGNLTTFGTEITFCQFNCYNAIKDSEKAQEKRMLPLTFDAFTEISETLENKMSTVICDIFL